MFFAIASFNCVGGDRLSKPLHQTTARACVAAGKLQNSSLSRESDDKMRKVPTTGFSFQQRIGSCGFGRELTHATLQQGKFSRGRCEKAG